MPPPKKRPVHRHFDLRLGSAAGTSVDDFHVLAHSSEYDEAFEHTKVPTDDFPSNRFTHVLHYTGGILDRRERVDDRLLTLWRSPGAELLAAGFPRGVFHIEPGGVSVSLLAGHRGVFTSLWGPSSDHVFACGMLPAFTLLRTFGRWRPLALPPLPNDVLHDLCGFSERDVYCVGGEGLVMHFDGSRWTVLEIPTTRALRCVAPVAGVYICAAGADGTLLLGDRRGFRLVPSGTTELIEGLAPLDDAVYFGTSDGVFRFDGRSLPTLVLAQPAARVSTLGDGLLIQHAHEAWTWDGRTLRPLDTVI